MGIWVLEEDWVGIVNNVMSLMEMILMCFV